MAPDGDTVAVKTSDCPKMEGLALEVIVVVVVAFTVRIRLAEDPV
jgi:hypothetical protein